MNKEEIIRNVNTRLIGQGDPEAVEKFFTTDYIAYAEDKKYKGHAFLKRYSRQIRKAIPDLTVLKAEFLADAGDTLVWQRTMTGTHKENLMGIPPSLKKVKWNEMVVSRFRGNKIAEEWVVSELAGMLLLKLPRNGK